MDILVIADVKPLLGERLPWDPVTDRQYFIDALGRRVFHRTEHGAEMRAWTVPSRTLRQLGADRAITGRPAPRFAG